jgi:RNA recognition motif-containing protein
MAVRLFVGNLAYDTTEAELREHFAAVGPLSYIYLPTDRETGKPRGFAFIEFSARADAEEAIRRLNHQEFKGRQLVVNEARARDERATTGTPRASTPRPPLAPDTSSGDSRHFGPDAPPRRRRKPSKNTAKAEREPRRPMRKRDSRAVRFGADDDDLDDDDVRYNDFASQGDDSVDADTE